MRYIFLFLCFLSFGARAQFSIAENIGGRVAITIQLGTTVNRVGMMAEAYGFYNFFQINVRGRWHYNFKSYGPPMKGYEKILSLGGVLAFGEPNDFNNSFLFPINQSLNRKYSLGYMANIYWDDIRTHQATGTLMAQIYRLYILTENDAFAGKAADKYRTAAAMAIYRFDETLVALNTVMWTGDPFTNFIDTQIKGTSYPSRFGYRDMRNATYGQYSHGILSGQIYRMLPYQQTARLNIGGDWEYFRHFFQNKMIHDLILVPKSWRKNETPHIPMKDTMGRDYFFHSDQKVKPASFFGEFELNADWFY